jgi:lysophospholipase L1-like esterase
MESNKNFWQKLIDGLELIASSYKARKGDPNAWEKTIKKFEIQDQMHPPAKNSILFIGSSSFTFWSTLEQDMAPLPIINRGFGGSYMRDVVRYIDRIVLPYQPRAVVMFVGTNDITQNNPHLAKHVFDGYLTFVQLVQAALPGVLIYYIGITPTPTRWKFWPIASEVNHLTREHTQKDPNLRFIDLTEQLLGEDGKPNRSLYKFDGIHPNPKGYAKWTEIIRPQLEADLSFN